MITYIKIQGYSVTHFDGKNYEKKEFQNSNTGGKQIENSCRCHFCKKFDFS